MFFWEIVILELSNYPFLVGLQELILVFYIENVGLMFSFVQVRFYATMSKAYVIKVQFPHITLSPKIGYKNLIIYK
jgi:hypothetical protein